MHNPSALIVWGGWQGHEPDLVADLFRDMLEADGLRVTVSSSLDSFLDQELLQRVDLIVPIVTMGKLHPQQRAGILKAIAEDGKGLAGCHGGMCDAFRDDHEWQFMTGGQWVAHPGDNNVRYTININREQPHPITQGIEDFEVVSEQYYLHTDPGNSVLATTEFPHPDHPGPHSGNRCKMPQIWTRTFGAGRVFYFAVGHSRDVLEQPIPKEIMRRGMMWAAR